VARHRLEYLEALGVTAYEPRPAARAGKGGECPAATDPTLMDWDGLAATVQGCRRCELCAGRTQTVFGVGDRHARLMVVGEAPGAEEDRQGEPFVGRAGRLLNAMLRAAGLSREQVYIANILKCRPPQNRDPQPVEVAQCLPYLLCQVELVAPALVLCVGRIAAQSLLATDSPLGRMRGRLHQLQSGVPVLVTYHPAYLLRAPGEKRKAWEDLKRVIEVLGDGHGA
jgi:uracil-DNA glycosylase family 4